MADSNLVSVVADATPGAPPDDSDPDIANPTAGATATPPIPVSQGQPDLPRFQRTFGNTLKGMLMGWAMNGIPGAVVGAVNPQGIQRQANAQAQAAATAHVISCGRRVRNEE